MPTHLVSPRDAVLADKGMLSAVEWRPLGLEVEQVHKVVVGQGTSAVRKDAVLGAIPVGTHGPHAAHQEPSSQGRAGS